MKATRVVIENSYTSCRLATRVVTENSYTFFRLNPPSAKPSVKELRSKNWYLDANYTNYTIRTRKIIESKYIYPAWYSNSTKRNIELKAKYHRLFKATKYQNFQQLFSEYRLLVKSNINVDFELYKTKFESNIKREPKLFWDYMNSKRAITKKKVLKDGELVPMEQCAQLFAKYFSSVYAQVPPRLSVDDALLSYNGDSSRIHIDSIVQGDVRRALKKLKAKRAAGPDGIPPYVDEEVKKQLPVVPKCCASGQNLTLSFVDGKVKSVCSRSTLTFQPIFHKANETHIWSYDSNVFETIVGNPCSYDRYKLEPDKVSEDEFYLLFNGSLFVPYSQPPLLGTRDFCMETFWNESNLAGVTLPLVCFQTPIEEATTSITLIAYATGLIISVPFLLATAGIYTFITELRDTHGKALACHSICLAVAFSCLAATQLAGHAFPSPACTMMAYLIQFSFVSCFFWLNVMCFDTYLNVRRYIHSSVSRRSMRRRFAWYCAYAILLPVILLIVTITMDLSPAVPSTYLKPNFGVKGCWFKTDQAALPYFYGPVAVILFSNLIIFLFTSRAFAKHYDKLKDVTPLDMTHSDFSTSDDWVRLGTVLGQPLPPLERSTPPPRDPPANFNQRLNKYKKIFRTCCMLSVIMGLSWVLEVVSWAAGAGTSVVSVWSVFDLINALQGVVIFGIFVLQQPVRSFVKFSKLCKVCRRKKDGSEVSVVSDRNSIDCGPGRRDFV